MIKHQNITIQTPYGPHTLEAEIFGPLAVHREYSTHSDTFSVTHRASGLRITPYALPLIPMRKIARILAKEDWNIETEPSRTRPGLCIKDAVRGRALDDVIAAAYKKVTGEKFLT